MADTYEKGRNLSALAFYMLLLVVSSAFIWGHLLPAAVGSGVALALPVLSTLTAIALLALCWFYVKTKGRSGWWVLLVPCLNIFGILVLVLLRSESRQ
ncbi:hypothetical protein AEP_02990 [Curvibacter sp. AEP1-3]|uniref:hypothetical protein n=1 Tax=Curvibacter sp. AEP1-3 TaxID=1844971 RepID=UPI000B3C155B|nr:hypothetical protein [Curvibacter sp. AEP1-3]ARV19915.1 hypothetical protein AEP_02990 [Curvibacter sp. AEP1-3]